MAAPFRANPFGLREIASIALGAAGLLLASSLLVTVSYSWIAKGRFHIAGLVGGTVSMGMVDESLAKGRDLGLDILWRPRFVPTLIKQEVTPEGVDMRTLSVLPGALVLIAASWWLRAGRRSLESHATA